MAALPKNSVKKRMPEHFLELNRRITGFPPVRSWGFQDTRHSPEGSSRPRETC
jgi:hypothetical protein